jgi:ADP-ribosylglycohydrolase
MFLEMAVADAYAIGWEFTDKQFSTADLTKYVQHPEYLELEPGQYTDDTQRSIANALVLLSQRPADKFCPPAYADAYLGVYNNDPREGYSRGFQALLKGSKDANDFLIKCQRNKISNGSVMGVAPLGFIQDLQELKLASTVQAITTHHPSAAIHAQIIAMSVHYFVFKLGKREDLRSWLLANVDWVDSNQANTWSAGVYEYDDLNKKTSIAASSISRYAVWSVENQNDLSEIIRDSCERGGDTDSAAACSVAIGSLCDQIQNNIPQILIDNLEPRGKFGVEYLRSLDQRLLDRFVKGR